MGKLRKLRSKRGESFAEVLIAVLIVAFGCLLIATLYSSAMNLDLRAAEADDAFYEALSETEQLFGGTPSGSGQAVLEDESGNKLEVAVDMYGEGDTSAYMRSGS